MTVMGQSSRRAPEPVDVALLTSSPTLGWRRNDASFVRLVREAGATCAVTPVTTGPAGTLARHPVAIDLVQAMAARHAASRLPPARAVVVSTVTCSFFQRLDVPWAVRFDAPAASNRPGWPGAWQRAIEPRALGRATVLVPLSAEGGAAAPAGDRPVVPVGVPIERIVGEDDREIDALAYAGNPPKRRLDLVARAWARAGAPGRHVVAGVPPGDGRAWLARCGVAEPAGLEWAGVVGPERWRALLGAARVFLAAARFEDHGIAPLEALSAGAALVTVPTPGPFPALRMARELAPALVSRDETAPALAEALGAGLALAASERRDYAERADALLAPHRAEAIRATIAERLLPALGVR